MSRYRKVYVEGPDDENVLQLMFTITGEMEPANGKQSVRKKVRLAHDCCGIVDQDFEVEGSDESRLAFLGRYALENYLLEPSYLFQFAKQIKIADREDWQSEEAVAQLIIKMGQDLCGYATANKLLYEYGFRVYDTSLMQYFKTYPVAEEEAVLQQLVSRFTSLPSEKEIRDAWVLRHKVILADCQTMEGIHRWIDGKVLLQGVYQAMREAYRRNLRYDDVVDGLARIAREQPPVDLVVLLQNFGLIR